MVGWAFNDLPSSAIRSPPVVPLSATYAAPHRAGRRQPHSVRVDNSCVTNSYDEMVAATPAFPLLGSTRTTCPSHLRRIGRLQDLPSNTKVKIIGPLKENGCSVSKNTPKRLTSRVMPAPSSSCTGSVIGSRIARRLSVRFGLLSVIMSHILVTFPKAHNSPKDIFCYSFRYISRPFILVIRDGVDAE